LQKLRPSQSWNKVAVDFWQLDRHRLLSNRSGVPTDLKKGEYSLLLAFVDAPKTNAYPGPPSASNAQAP
jgi:hypothetical protein